MKKKRTICMILVFLAVIAILLIPIPQRIEKTLYATDTQSGAPATITLDLTFYRFLILNDKPVGKITFENDTQKLVFGERLSQWFYHRYPTNNADKQMHALNGFYYDGTTNTQHGYVLYLGVDFDKAVLTLLESNANTNNEYLANVEKNKETETYQYFTGFVKNDPATIPAE